jgi:hypothetical protein
VRERRFYLTTGLAALLLRVVLMPFSLHVDPRFGGDLLAINGAAATFIQDPHFGGTPYPPLAMWMIGLFQALWRLPLPANLSSTVEPRFEALGAPDIFYALFASKTLYLVFDLAAALLWLRIYRNKPRERRLAWLFWIFNPLVIYNAYIHGQYDLLPVFFVVVSLYFAKRGQPRWAALWLGIGGCFKNFPLFFLLPLLIIFGKSWRERLILFAIGAIPYLVLMAPFLGAYRRSISGYSNWYFRASYDLGFGAQVYLFVVFYAILLWYLYQRRAHTFEDLWRACFAVLLVYYQFSYFDLHYWAWIIPMATIYWVQRPREATPFYIVILTCLLVLTAPTPLARFLAPISPRFFLRVPSLIEALSPYLPMLFIVNVVRSLLAGTCFYLAWRLLRDMPASRGGAVEVAPSQTKAT